MHIKVYVEYSIDPSCSDPLQAKVVFVNKETPSRPVELAFARLAWMDDRISIKKASSLSLIVTGLHDKTWPRVRESAARVAADTSKLLLGWIEYFSDAIVNHPAAEKIFEMKETDS